MQRVGGPWSDFNAHGGGVILFKEGSTMIGYALDFWSNLSKYNPFGMGLNDILHRSKHVYYFRKYTNVCGIESSWRYSILSDSSHYLLKNST